MDAILHDLLNTIAPLVLQILAAVVLAAISALLLKGKELVQGELSAQQQGFVAALASTAVHLAEQQGLGKTGVEKAELAQQFVGRELAAAGISTLSGSDVGAAIIGAVQRAWAHEIGPTEPPPTEVLRDVIAQATAATPAPKPADPAPQPAELVAAGS